MPSQDEHINLSQTPSVGQAPKKHQRLEMLDVLGAAKITYLDVGLASLSSNTVTTTAPSFGVTTDNFPVYLPPGGGTSDWKRILLSGDGNLASFFYMGDAVDGREFGFYTSESDEEITALSLFAQVPPDGSDLLLEIVKNGSGTGTEFGLSSGVQTLHGKFSAALNTGDSLSFRVKASGINTPGGYLTLNVHMKTLL